MEQIMSEMDLKLWAIDTLQHLEEMRLDINNLNSFTDNERIEFDKKLSNVKTLLSKLLTPQLPPEEELKQILKRATIEFAAVGIIIVTRTLLECKKMDMER